MVLVQKWPFLYLLVLGNKIRENVFYDILERKKAFLGYKNMMFKKTKIFSSKKWPFFRLCFLGNIGQENVFYDILDEKKRLSRL